MERQKTTEHLKHSFNEEELKELATSLVACLRHKSATEDELKTISQQLKADVQAQEGQIRALTNKLDAGYEFRPTECEWVYSWSTGRKSLVRLDTGEDVRNERITDDERQQNLFEFETAAQALKEAMDHETKPKTEG